MAQHVTLQQAVDHLVLQGVLVLAGSPVDPREADLQLTLDAAEEAIFDYVTDRATWPNPDAAVLKKAILIQCAELWRFRGDDDEPDPIRREAPGDLSPTVKALLYRWRRPVFA
jgi:hypothetical protein